MIIRLNRAKYRRFFNNMKNIRLPFLQILTLAGLCNLILLRVYLQHFTGIDTDTYSPPSLWGFQENNKLGPSIHIDRMETLDTWIKLMSQEEHLNTLKTKTLLIFEGGSTRWGGLNFNNSNTTLCTKKCIYLDGQDHYGKEMIHRADGVLFIRDWYYQSKVYIPHDKFKILSFLESPLASSGRFDQNNIILASYHRASDIVIPYGKWINKPINDSMTQNDKPIRNYAKGKTQIAAIFVSHCQVTNHRMQYVNQLKEHIPVHIYGSCGNYHCPRSQEQECFSKLKNDYKFYLAFENANCRDYITEKLYRNALSNDIVPIVLGAHRNDYKAMAPPHSYIHVEDFESPQLLAEYLKILDKNDTLYNEYFAWKTKGQFLNPPSYVGTLCRMCAMLHYKEYSKLMPPSRVDQSWKSFDRCLPQGEWYWERHRPDIVNQTISENEEDM